MSDNSILARVIESANDEQLEKIDQVKDELIESDKHTVKIHSGDAISDVDINKYLAKNLVKLIVLAGLPNNGKTTLISSIYDKFIQYGEYGDFQFAGYRTVLGFEKRCYLARLKHGQYSDTKRTSLNDDNPYLEISLKHKDLNRKQTLIFVDTSGEVFQKFQNDNNSICEFKSLQRANHFSYIFDISQFKKAELKHLAIDTAKTIFKSINDQNVFAPNVNVEIIFTKWDVINEAETIEFELFQKYKESIVNDIKKILPTHCVVDFHVSAVLDDQQFQLKDLFNHWMKSPCIHEYSHKIENEKINWEEDYHKYLDDER